MVSLIGFQAAGMLGALTATAAMCVPSCVVTYFVVRRWERSRDERLKRIVQRGLAPITIGLVTATGYLLSRAAIHDGIEAVLLVATFVLMVATKRNPLWIFAAAAILGVVGIA
jgi:chromate transporter